MTTSQVRLGECDACGRTWPVSLLRNSSFERNGVGDASIGPCCTVGVECLHVFETGDLCDLPEEHPVHSSLMWTPASHEYEGRAS